MGLFKKKADPIIDRSKALNAQIASLEAEIKRLDVKLQQGAMPPRQRPAPYPHNAVNSRSASKPGLGREPVFEPVDKGQIEPAVTPDHYNDLGVRKYDLAGAWNRLRSYLRGPPASNPRLLTYLAAGSIKGLRPLRYEKRIARRRFIGLFLLLVGLLWGIISAFVRSN